MNAPHEEHGYYRYAWRGSIFRAVCTRFAELAYIRKYSSVEKTAFSDTMSSLEVSGGRGVLSAGQALKKE
jgi:hypothetical protein